MIQFLVHDSAHDNVAVAVVDIKAAQDVEGRELVSNKTLRATVHLWADLSRRTCVWAEAYYQQKRTRGMNHTAALRCLGQRWVKILWKMWQTGTPYDEALHTRNQTAHGSLGDPAAPPARPGQDLSRQPDHEVNNMARKKPESSFTTERTSPGNDRARRGGHSRRSGTSLASPRGGGQVGPAGQH